MTKNIINQVVRTNRKITLIGKNGQAEGQLVDLSLTEAGVLTKRGAREGTDLELVFELPALEDFITLHINATVTHRHSSENEIYLKLSFAPLKEMEDLALADFIDYKNRLLKFGQRKYKQ